MRVCLDIEGKVAFFTPAGHAVFDAPRGGLPRRPSPPSRASASSSAPTPTAIAPLPPAPPVPAIAYPGADRWRHDRGIPWDIEARAMEALDA